MKIIIEVLTVILLILSGIYLSYKVPDVIVNGFEHGSDIYVQLSANDFQISDQQSPT